MTILTQSGGAGVDRFLCITKPIEFRNAVMNQKVSDQRGNAGAAQAAVAPAPVAAAAPSGPPAMTSAEAATAIASLADLRDRRAITTDEFETKKAEMLARM